MPLDINALRRKLNQMSGSTSRKDIQWKPPEGTTTIRIVPYVKNPENPFVELFFHYIGRKTYLSPLNFDERDPIHEFGQAMLDEGGLTKEEWKRARDFLAKPRTFVPVIVRGQEEQGVRWWAFGKTVFEQLATIMTDPDYGDITDPNTGRDIKVTFIPAEKSPTKFAKTEILISPKQTALTSNAELKQKLLTNQPDLFELFERQSYDELSRVLEKYLNPSSEPERVTVSKKDSSANWDDEPVESPTAKKAAASQAVSVDFDEIWNNG